jgi:hypothetical protein
MLDLAEGAKIIDGYIATGILTSGYADVINTENMHCVWAICQAASSGSGTMNFQGYVCDDYTGAGDTRAVCQYWRTTGAKIDRMVASSNTTGLEAEAAGGTVLIRFDPASRSDSSQQYFTVAYATNITMSNITYICQPRYAGLGQILATSSST